MIQLSRLLWDEATGLDIERMREREALNERENQWIRSMTVFSILESSSVERFFFSFSLFPSSWHKKHVSHCLRHTRSEAETPVIRISSSGNHVSFFPREETSRKRSKFRNWCIRKKINRSEGRVCQAVDWLPISSKFQIPTKSLPSHSRIYIFRNWKWTKEEIFKGRFSNNCHNSKGKKVMNEEFFQTYYFTHNVRIYLPTFFPQHFDWNLSSLEKAFSQEWNSYECQMSVNMEQHPVGIVMNVKCWLTWNNMHSMESGLHALCHPHNCEHHKLRWE